MFDLAEFKSLYSFCLLRIPVSIILILDKEDRLPISAHTFTNLPAHLNSAINPIFYGIFKSKIRQGYKYLFNTISGNRLFKSVTSYKGKPELQLPKLQNHNKKNDEFVLTKNNIIIQDQ